ncbi:MAG: acyltransferase [Bacteroidaceae bacterium]|nr:acyltransferase [Bacteroidaceae bacterium]
MDIINKQELTMSKVKQIEWVNIAKGVAIIAVVLSHTEHGLNDYKMLPIESLVYGLWYVPVFFILSGFFIKEERLCKPADFIKGKMKSLYLLLLYFYIPAVLLHNVILDIGFYDTTTSYGGTYLQYYEPLTFIKKLLMACCFMGGETILGAMWFVYVLLLALIMFSLTSYALKTFVHKSKYEYARCIVLLLLCIASCFATKLFNLTIPRFNNVFTAMWLIYCGYILNQRIKIKYDNKWILLISCIFVYHIASLYGVVKLNSNKFADVITLTAGSIASLYIICFFAKKIEHNCIGKILAYCGRDSFYIMAMHFLGFKILTLVLNLFGFDFKLSSHIAPSEGNTLLTILYITAGVLFPISFIFIFRFIKSKLHK